MAMIKPRLPSAHDPTPNDGDLAIGDIHGDLPGLQNVLKEAKWNPDKQRLFTVGDLVDRGHDAKGVMDFLHQYGATNILGNHDWMHARNAHHVENEMATGKKNPMKPKLAKSDTMRQFGDVPTYLQYAKRMANFPLYLSFEDSQGPGYMVHGGVDPFNSMENQQPDKLMVRRHHPMPDYFLEGENEQHPYWQRSYKGHLGTIVHGHHPMEKHDNFPNVVSLDGGGAFGSLQPWGGKHRAMRFGDRKIFEAPGSSESEANYRRILMAKNHGEVI